jgi:Ca2+/Na+ antiporter
MGLATILSVGAWFFVIWTTDPFESGLSGLALFYITLGMSLIGSLTLSGVFYRVGILGRRDVVTREVKTSFRHAIALSLVAMISLMLSAQGQLRWWYILGLIVITTMIEYVFLMKDESRRS